MALAPAESLDYFPELEDYTLGPERYLEHLRRIKQSVAIPVIGSLNGVSPGGWVEYARELNIYAIPTDVNVSAADLENIYIELVREVRARVKPTHRAQTQSLLHLAATCRQALRRSRRKWPGALQPLLPARL